MHLKRRQPIVYQKRGEIQETIIFQYYGRIGRLSIPILHLIRRRKSKLTMQHYRHQLIQNVCSSYLSYQFYFSTSLVNFLFL
jgi:hypothetical protein